MQYAGFWRRLVAAIIDGILVSIVTLIIGGVLRLNSGLPTGPGSDNFLANLINLIIGWIYYAAMESSEKQATLGKMAIGIQVTDLEGNRISFGRATGRYFAKILSAIILLIGYIMAGFTARKQALHDMLAGCLVVKKSGPEQ